MKEAEGKHPCFNIEAKGKYGRVHLPIAPKCNIQCNYCNRKYDCVNESRPGVTSSVLLPYQAVEYFKALHEKHPNITVAGIAGPGDPFANPEETMATLRTLRKEVPEVVPCLSSNGLGILPYIDELAELNVDHVTITINSLNVETLAQIYPWIRYEKRVFRGVEGAQILLDNQLKAIKLLKEKGITVKINSIVIPGVNDKDLTELAEKVAELGADVMNCIPLYPVEETGFADVTAPTPLDMKLVRAGTNKHIKPMLHCARCRADAAGLLGQDIEESTQMLRDFSQLKEKVDENRKYVAVATHEGILVNQHLGEASKLYIFKETESGYKLIDQRKTPLKGAGDGRWKVLAETISDCRTILVAGIGESPYKFISDSGCEIIEMTGLIDEGLDAVYKGKTLRTVKKRDAFKCGSSCSGTGGGCG